MTARVPPAPAEHPMAASNTCDWDDCPGLSIAWRWRSGYNPRGTVNPRPGQWLPVCRKHARGRVAWPTAAQCDAAGQPHRRPTPKPKGPTRTQLRAKCDRLFAEHIRSHGECEAAGVDGIACSDRFQCAHILSRKHLGTRWHPLNALCLCSAHHVWFTHHELHWERWRDAYVAPYTLELLREVAISHRGTPPYAEILADLEAHAGGLRPAYVQIARAVREAIEAELDANARDLLGPLLEAE